MMKKLLLAAAISATLMTAGCTTVDSEQPEDTSTMNHDHQKMKGSHSHGENATDGKRMEGHDHQKMKGNYSSGENDHEQMKAAGHDKKKMNHDHQEMKGSHGGHEGGHGSEESLAGQPGNEADVSRVINVEADDNMRFSHEPFKIKDGETIKFVVTNKGLIPHEFAIGTKEELMEHGKMMMSNPDMKHGPGGNAIRLEPGESKSIIWKFENAWQIEAACNIPGHYQAGMHSPITVQE
jgi:uncharacterized cupredoxin-like copper-binding protein